MLNWKTGVLIAAISSLGACTAGDPNFYETAPVQVKTAKGVVTCQLYTRDRVLWDRAIDIPGGMSVRAADEVCKEAGRKLQNT